MSDDQTEDTPELFFGQDPSFIDAGAQSIARVWALFYGTLIDHGVDPDHALELTKLWAYSSFFGERSKAGTP